MTAQHVGEAGMLGQVGKLVESPGDDVLLSCCTSQDVVKVFQPVEHDLNADAQD